MNPGNLYAGIHALPTKTSVCNRPAESSRTKINLQAMQFEQPAELNRYIDATIPHNWTVRWRALKPALPILVCCSILLVEQTAFRLWLNDRSLVSELPLLFVCSLVPVALGMLAFEVQVRLTHRAKRRITL